MTAKTKSNPKAASPANAQAQRAKDMDPGAHQSDHEWRLKMAAEGKAFYLPGKSVEETRAGLFGDRGRDDEYVTIPILSRVFNASDVKEPVEPQDDTWLSINLSDEESDLIDTALPDAIDLIRDAGELLTFLSVGASLGHFNSDDRGYAALLRLSVRSFKGAEYREIRALELLEDKYRRSMSKAIDRDAMRKQTARFNPSE